MLDARRVAQDFSSAAPQYDAEAALQQRVLAKLSGHMLPMLPAFARVLDAGCGTGRFTRQHPDINAMQLDVASAMCRKAATDQAPAVNGRVESLPFAEGTFDGVICSLVLQWSPDARAAMEEMRRVLKPGGVLAVSLFGPSTLKELKESFAAVDSYPHVLPFTPAAACDHKEVITEYYPGLLSLMSRLKAIGARNKLVERRRSLMTPKQMGRVEERYWERFATPRGLPATWEVLYSVVRKV